VKRRWTYKRTHPGWSLTSSTVRGLGVADGCGESRVEATGESAGLVRRIAPSTVCVILKGGGIRSGSSQVKGQPVFHSSLAPAARIARSMTLVLRMKSMNLLTVRIHMIAPTRHTDVIISRPVLLCMVAMT
jgi:hypothetical protein